MTLTAILAGIIAVLGGIIAAFLKGRQTGKEAVDAKQQKADAYVQAEFQRIDSARPDLDGALGRLRKRAAPDGDAKTK